jgi:glutamate dehydrogenase (NAD(P)+)
MEDIFRFADHLGPAKIVHITEPSTGLKAVVVVDNVAAGPSIGGVRMAPNVTTEECFRLARAMTMKNAAAGLPHGGGKSVIVGDPKATADEKERQIRAFANAIRDLSEQDEIGRSVGLPPELGGIPLDEIGATGFGLAVAVDVARGFCDLELKGARLAVQGFGSVGQHAARFLAEQGVVLVAAADSHGTLYSPKGIDLDRLIEAKRAGGAVTDYPDGEKLGRDDVIDIECEIWIPAARPDVIDADNVDRLTTKLVVQGANIPVTAEAEATLHRRGVLSVPDFIANAGGVICAAVEYGGGTQTTAFETIEEKVRVNTRQVLEQAAETDKTPRQAALELAEQRVLRAMDYRRWS